MAHVPTQLSRMTLMIAAGSRSNYHAMQEELSGGGYDVVIARSSEEALQATYSHRPHLAIIDVSLPDADGAQLADRLKTDETLGFLPVILLTDPPRNGSAAPVSQADVVLPRTVPIKDLWTWINALLRIRGQFDHLVYENRRLARESEIANRLKLEIIDTVSHELRTPLLQVKSAVYLLSEDIDKGRQHDQASLAHMATQAVARLERVVDSMRQLAQTDDVRLDVVDIREAAQLAFRYLERSWAPWRTLDRIDLEIAPDLPLVVADKRVVGRLLQLLLDNALKFSPRDTRVTVLAYQISQNRVWIGVQDRGIGIPPEEHSRIFQAFYQVDGSSSGCHGGTGTGLSLAVLLARSMNTTIHLESEVGIGSTFWFLLPIAGVDKPPESPG